MVTLEVGLDASKVVGGAHDAFAALMGITNAARQALEGVERIGGATGAFATLGATITKVVPFIAAGSAVIAAITSSMALFSKTTADATEGYKKLGDTLRTTSAEVDVAKLFGDPNLSKSVNQRNVAALFERAVATKRDGTNISLGEFSGQLGPDIGSSDIIDALRNDPGLSAFRSANRFSTSVYDGSVRKRSDGEIDAISGQYQLSPAQQIDVLRRIATQYGQQPGSLIAGESFPGLGRPGQTTNDFSLKDSIGQPFNGVRISQDDQSKVNIENMQRAMADIERSSQRVGQYLGDAATALVTGAAGWRDIAQQVIQDLIRAGLTQGFTSLSKSFLSGFGATPAQT